MARYELTEEQRYVITLSLETDLEDPVRFYGPYRANVIAGLGALKTPVLESRGGLSEGHRKEAVSILRCWLKGYKVHKSYRPIVLATIEALNAPAEPCGECEKLLAKVAELQEHDITRCFEHGQQLATVKAECRIHEANAVAAGKLLSEAKAECVRLEARCDTLASGCKRQASENSGLVQRLTEARAECERLKGELATTNNHALAREQKLAEARAEREDWKETAQILGSTKEMKAIKKSLTDIKAGRVQDGKEVFAELEAEQKEELLTVDDYERTDIAFRAWYDENSHPGVRGYRAGVAREVLNRLRKLTQRAEAETEQEKNMQRKSLETDRKVTVYPIANGYMVLAEFSGEHTADEDQQTLEFAFVSVEAALKWTLDYLTADERGLIDLAKVPAES